MKLVCTNNNLSWVPISTIMLTLTLIFFTKGLRYYYVRWKGYGEEEDTWEPEGNLDGCEDVLKLFWEGQKNMRKRVSTGIYLPIS